MRLISPGGGIVEATGEHAERLLALGWKRAELPKGQDKPKRRTKKTE